jgi:hypothetical protein
MLAFLVAQNGFGHPMEEDNLTRAIFAKKKPALQSNNSASK